MTRSAIKPRLLFPSEEEKRARELAAIAAETGNDDEVDEEALTDIEMSEPAPQRSILSRTSETQGLATPVKKSHPAAETGVATPPTTVPRHGRSTRRTLAFNLEEELEAVHEEVEPSSSSLAVPSSGKGTKSPFDSWARTKNDVATRASGGRKRGGAAVEEVEGTGKGKRVRGGV